MSQVLSPKDGDSATIDVGGRKVALTNLRKRFWTDPLLVKRDLIQYYADIAPVLLPHLRHRAMVMKGYPDGADGEFFYMKRAPQPRPEWIQICSIPHRRGNVIDFAIVNDLAALLWMINLGCIDLHPWYGRCDDFDRPDFLHFDLDPVPGAGFQEVLKVALIVRQALDSLGMPAYVKTTGSRGIHVYVPIVRGPLQKEVWAVAKVLALDLETRHPNLVTAQYRVARRPHGHVLVDYNQNAWGRTLASAYSVRPRPYAPVSAPVTWEEVERGVRIEDFTMAVTRARAARLGDLWKPLVSAEGRFDLSRLF